MKNLLVFCVFFSYCIIAQQSKTTFIDLKQLEEARSIGTISYYVPTYLNGFKTLGLGESIKTFSYDVSAKCDVVGGTFWVLFEPGTEFVVKNGKIVRLYKCGNKISGFHEFSSIKLSTERKKEDIPKNTTATGVIDVYHHFPESLNLKVALEKDNDSYKKSRENRERTYSYNSGWTASNTIVTIIATGIGAAAGGYCFKITEESTGVTEIPGVRVEAGNGTPIFGPNQVIITKSYSKKFNVAASVACGLGSGVLTYFINKLVID